jgi:hypothetical protein
VSAYIAALMLVVVGVGLVLFIFFGLPRKH